MKYVNDWKSVDWNFEKSEFYVYECLQKFEELVKTVLHARNYHDSPMHSCVGLSGVGKN